jgi:hypothetical protein
VTILVEQPQSEKKFESIIDRAIMGTHEAQFDQGERNGKIAQEAKIMAEKARMMACQNLIKGMDSLKRASENPEATKKAVKEAFGGGLGKIKGIFTKS